MEEQLLALIAEVCDSDDIYELRDADLFDEGLIDSMGAVDLLIGIEELTSLVIAPTEVEREDMNTVNKIIYQVGKRLQS